MAAAVFLGLEMTETLEDDRPYNNNNNGPKVNGKHAGKVDVL